MEITFRWRLSEVYHWLSISTVPTSKFLSCQETLEEIHYNIEIVWKQNHKSYRKQNVPQQSKPRTNTVGHWNRVTLKGVLLQVIHIISPIYIIDLIQTYLEVVISLSLRGRHYVSQFNIVGHVVLFPKGAGRKHQVVLNTLN